MKVYSNAPSPTIVEPARRDERVQKAAEMYEDQFLREMVRAMKKSIPESDLVKKNMGEKIFQDQLDETHVEAWVNKGGVGLADLIYNNIMDRVRSEQALLKQGSLPLKQSSMKPIEAASPAENKNTIDEKVR